jgi:hypothetical protein
LSATYAEPETPTGGNALDPEVKKKISRGRSRMQQGAPLANECIRFWRNDQYVYRSGAAYSAGQLQSQPTLYGSDNFDAHRMRTTRNMILDVVAQETSASTQRVPGYDITPSTTDNADIGAAALSKKVADYGYDEWRIRNATVRIVEYATIQGEGFAWPFFDNTIGTPLADTGVCTGDVNVRVYGRNQVMWEPGVLFEDSRWHAVEYAEPIDRVKAMPGYPRRGAQGGHRRERRSTRRSMPRRRTSCASRTTWSARARSTAGPAHRSSRATGRSSRRRSTRASGRTRTARTSTSMSRRS